jgi:hypothetical protein
MPSRTACLLAAALLVLGPAPAPAEFIVFNFEDQPATYVPPGPRPGALRNLVLTRDGLTVSVTRAGARFDVVANVAPGQVKPPAWGLRSLDPFFDVSPASGPFVLDFSVPLAAFALDVGDYGQDADRVVLQAFSGPGGTGALLASAAAELPGGPDVFAFVTLGVASAAPIRSVVVLGGEVPGFNSVFYDNLRAEPVPEPAALALFGVGAVVLLGRRCRPRRGRMCAKE